VRFSHLERYIGPLIPPPVFDCPFDHIVEMYAYRSGPGVISGMLFVTTQGTVAVRGDWQGLEEVNRVLRRQVDLSDAEPARDVRDLGDVPEARDVRPVPEVDSPFPDEDRRDSAE
jgi:hypothetical protein